MTADSPMTPKLQELLTQTQPVYDVMCECGLHRVTNTEPQVCTRCQSRNLTITILAADAYHELT